MIENPDGSKRLPTKEELLENVRRKQHAISGSGSSSETPVRTNQDTNRETGQFHVERRGETFHVEGRDRFNESGEGGRNGTDVYARSPIRETGKYNGGSNEYSNRTTATSEPTVNYAPPIRRSRFQPYREAIQESLKK